MSESPEGAPPDAEIQPPSVTEPESTKRDEASPEGPEKRAGGRGWRLACLVLLVLLIGSSGAHLMQRSAQGALESETAQAFEVLAAETARADAAELEADALRSAIGDVHATMTSLQESLSQTIATTGGLLDPGELAQSEPEASSFEVVAEPAGHALEAVGEAEATGSATGNDPEPTDGELPDVAAGGTPGDSEEGGLASTLSNTWDTTREGLSQFVDRVTGE